MWRRERVLGAPITAGALRITPESEQISLALPFWQGMWHRPTAVLVEGEGRRDRVPIVDVTRQGQLALVAATALLGLLGWLVAGNLRRKR